MGHPQSESPSASSPPSPSPPGPADPAGHPASSRPTLLQLWLAALAAIAALACLRALLLPPWPKAQPLRPQPLQARLIQVGLDPRPLPSQPLRRSHDLALSARLAWRLPGAGVLRLASVEVRRRDDFQVAWITRGLPQLSLRQRQLDRPQPGVASGRLQGRPAVQTCLVPQGSSPATPAVTLRALQQAVDRHPLSPADRLRQLVGLRQPRELRCLLVTLQSPTAEPPPPHIWRRLLAALQEVSDPPRRP